ncbi:MAG: TetR family transcriptional regulator [Actinomycetota bacterium]
MVTNEQLSLTPSQSARRQRVLDAAMQLAATGGYDAVQMRDVAATADVAMGTVYRYFTSKDHLLAAAMVYWVDQLYVQLGSHPPKGSSPAERVLEVLDRALRSMNRVPLLGAALFTSINSADPAAIEAQQQVTTTLDAIVLQAIGTTPPIDAQDRSRMIGHIWYSAMVGWVAGWSPIERIYRELEIAVDLLLPTS